MSGELAAAIALVLLLGRVMVPSKRLTIEQLRQLARSTGWPNDVADVAAAIAMAESGGDPEAHGDRTLGHSWGLWQIHQRTWAKVHPEWFTTPGWITNPSHNAEAALSVYHRAGNSFTPWTTYRQGLHKRYMPR